MSVTALHPILYVEDQYAERDFYLRFGFETIYEGPEFPGFLALSSGAATFGLSGNLDAAGGATFTGARWQFLVDDVDHVVAVCESAGLGHEVVVETGGAAHRTRIVQVRSPNGILVCFEGPNEAG